MTTYHIYDVILIVSCLECALAATAPPPAAQALMENAMTSVKSAERVLSLFEFFAQRQSAATITEIAHALSIPQSSTSMLARNLVELGYLEQDQRKRTYFPTLRIALLSEWMNRKTEVAGPLAKLLDIVRSETEETVILAIRNDIYAQYILVQDSPDPLRLQVQSGILRPMTCCAPGRIILSMLPDAEIQRIARRTNLEVQSNHLVLSEAFVLQKVKEARKLGFAMTDGDMTPGAGSISITLPIPIGQKPLAISVGGPSNRIAEKRGKILDCLFTLRDKFSVCDMSKELESASAPLPLPNLA